MEKSRKFRRSALVTLTITSSLAATACCDRDTSATERNRRSAWWRFWHNQTWCGGYSHGGGYVYGGGSRGPRGSASATTRGGFGPGAHGSSGT